LSFLFIVHIDASQPAFMKKPYYFQFWQICMNMSNLSHSKTTNSWQLYILLN